MGILAGPSFITMEGFQIPGVYLTIETMEFKRVLKGSAYVASFRIHAYKDRENRIQGTNPLTLNNRLRYIEVPVSADAFYFKTPYAIGYEAIKAKWTKEGYTVSDVFEVGQKPATAFIYDTEGYDYHGFNVSGVDREGYDRQGFNTAGIDREGYNQDGYNQAGYNRQGYDTNGFNKDGYKADGYNAAGYDRDGYNATGYDQDGYDREGFNVAGYNAAGESKYPQEPVAEEPAPEEPAPEEATATE